jgi:hypothetical protein
MGYGEGQVTAIFLPAAPVLSKGTQAAHYSYVLMVSTPVVRILASSNGGKVNSHNF